MRYLLDTDICIYLIRRRPSQVLDKFNAHSFGDIGISTVTAAELWYGVRKSQHAAQNQRALDQFLLPLAMAEFDEPAASAYGEIRAALEAQGSPIGPLDTLIAAQAVSQDVILVTNNVREFSRVPGLRIENWAAD
jgi:tRNA(fMet)-specific endonuclease VapC